MKSLLLLSVVALATGCVSLTASDSVGDTQSLSFNVPALPLTVCQTLPATNSPSIDMSDFFKSLKKNGSLSVNFDESELSGTLTDFKHAAISLVQADGTTTLLSDTDFTAVNGVVNLPFIPTSDQLVAVLSTGPVNVQVNMTACNTTAGTQTVNYTLHADVSFTSHKL